MYKLFIADDEAIIREGLRCLLDWEHWDLPLQEKRQTAMPPCNSSV
ncbi:MAG: hypothetical protein ACLR78_12615 [Roseburia sp.]